MSILRDFPDSKIIKYLKEHIFVYSIALVLVVALANAASHIVGRSIDNLWFERLPNKAFSIDQMLSYLPLSKGNYWIYRGDFEAKVLGKKKFKGPVSIKMTVKNVYKKDKLAIVEIEGHPRDILGQTSLNIKPNKSYYIIAGNKIYAAFSNNKELLDKAIKKVKKIGMLHELDSPEIVLDLEFEFPLVVGSQYNADPFALNKLGMFTNYVSKRFYNVSYNNYPYSYLIEEKYNPEDFETIFQPYLGITEYRYKHYGTINELDLYLHKSNVKTERSWR